MLSSPGVALASPVPRKPQGKHPARSRRKAKRRRVRALWETPTHWNVLTFPVVGLVALGGQAIVMAPLFVEIPLLQEHGWLAAPIMLGWITGFACLILRPCMHLHWNFTDELIQSSQPGRGGTYRRTWPNADFIAAEPFGPLMRVRRQSGETHFWPRWLFRARELYVLELQHARLRLQPLRQPKADARAR